ncbi:MAG TPA: UDP-N-acetylmuramoyl-tripeptide--D-alanyl-D-alanine ligase [Firmicutes bacterium]|jgi:UDP-N-acetylmuramoyl-tripeptide--D-alanyl-D-alanine ligase|nr:UDP-N-acetylmuramoyl-tripeptide--D-alanyl-D-alanine ligase [Bacillota bacterium]
MSLSVEEILKATDGELLAPGKNLFTGFLIDSRQASGGELFFPLQGEKEDGHSYIADALRKGAAGSLLERGRQNTLRGVDLPRGKTLIAVDDTLQALHKLACLKRQKYLIPLIAITGSNGKTTTKDFVASVLATSFNVLKTEGNLNNHLGLPLTLLQLDKGHEMAVLEMGMSGPGEIALLASLARPSLGIVTNIGEAHIEHLGSVENIFRAKNELLVAMGEKGTAFLNGDDHYLRRMGEDFPGQVSYFGFGKKVNLRAVNYFSCGDGVRFTALMPGMDLQEFQIPVPGKHNVYNALAAVAVGLHFNMEIDKIRQGLAGAGISAMRMERRVAGGGFEVINDTYNASPSSMKAALLTLRDLAGKGRAIAVLGDMLELGDMAEEGHLGIGKYLADLSLDYLVTVGEQAALIGQGAREAGFAGERIYEAKNPREALEHLFSIGLEKSCILVKGSRAMRLEQIAEGLLSGCQGSGIQHTDGGKRT